MRRMVRARHIVSSLLLIGLTMSSAVPAREPTEDGIDRSLHADAYVTFILGANGEVVSIRMKMLSPDTDFSFDYHHLDLRRVAEN